MLSSSRPSARPATEGCESVAASDLRDAPTRLAHATAASTPRSTKKPGWKRASSCPPCLRKASQAGLVAVGRRGGVEDPSHTHLGREVPPHIAQEAGGVHPRLLAGR